MKKTRSTKRTVAIIAVTVGIAAFVASCQRRGPSQTAFEWRPQSGLTIRSLGPVLDELEATEEQRAQLRTLIDEWTPVLTELASSAQRARESFLEEFEAEQPDTASLHAVIDEQAEALRSVGHELIDDLAALHETLTPEQRDAIGTHWERGSTHHRSRWGGRWWREPRAGSQDR